MATTAATLLLLLLLMHAHISIAWVSSSTGIVGRLPSPSLLHTQWRSTSTSTSSRTKLYYYDVGPPPDTAATVVVLAHKAAAQQQLSASSSSSLLLLAQQQESWRQYVPLVVSCLVIVDILLGSPAANAVLGLVRPADETTADAQSSKALDEKQEQEEDDDTSSASSGTTTTSPVDELRELLERQRQEIPATFNNNEKGGERVDSDAVAKSALNKAQNALELRTFLDGQKTDWDRMDDMKRRMDAEMESLDSKLEEKKRKMEDQGD